MSHEVLADARRTAEIGRKNYDFFLGAFSQSIRTFFDNLSEQVSEGSFLGVESPRDCCVTVQVSPKEASDATIPRDGKRVRFKEFPFGLLCQQMANQSFSVCLDEDRIIILSDDTYDSSEFDITLNMYFGQIEFSLKRNLGNIIIPVLSDCPTFRKAEAVVELLEWVGELVEGKRIKPGKRVPGVATPN